MDKSNITNKTHKLSENLPTRKNIRAHFHDYSGGEYFVTICTKNKQHYFGHITNDEMQYSRIGKYCKDQITELSKHYKYAEVLLYVIMPNHIHAIIVIHKTMMV